MQLKDQGGQVYDTPFWSSIRFEALVHVKQEASGRDWARAKVHQTAENFWRKRDDSTLSPEGHGVGGRTENGMTHSWAVFCCVITGAQKQNNHKANELKFQDLSLEQTPSKARGETK